LASSHVATAGVLSLRTGSRRLLDKFGGHSDCVRGMRQTLRPDGMRRFAGRGFGEGSYTGSPAAALTGGG
jgi:hypothetical protein